MAQERRFERERSRAEEWENYRRSPMYGDDLYGRGRDQEFGDGGLARGASEYVGPAFGAGQYYGRWPEQSPYFQSPFASHIYGERQLTPTGFGQIQYGLPQHLVQYPGQFVSGAYGQTAGSYAPAAFASFAQPYGQIGQSAQPYGLTYGQLYQGQLSPFSYGPNHNQPVYGFPVYVGPQLGAPYAVSYRQSQPRLSEVQGWTQMAQHRGLGPKNYIRSDERIREDVSDRLCDDPIVDASDIEVSVKNGEVILSGTVESREQRHRAEDCVEYVSGVRQVQNNIRVIESPLGNPLPQTGSKSQSHVIPGKHSTTTM